MTERTPLEQYEDWQQLVRSIRQEVLTEKVELHPLTSEVALESDIDAFAGRYHIRARMNMNGKSMEADESIDILKFREAACSLKAGTSDWDRELRNLAANLADLLMDHIHSEVRDRLYNNLLGLLARHAGRLG